MTATVLRDISSDADANIGLRLAILIGYLCGVGQVSLGVIRVALFVPRLGGRAA